MAWIKHYYIISCNAVYHALIGALNIYIASTSMRLVLKRAQRRPRRPNSVRHRRLLIFIFTNYKYESVERIRCYCPCIWATPAPTPSPSFCTGCCVVLPAQVSPNPFPRPCCAINPHPQTIGQSWHYHDLMETRMSRVSKEGTPSKLELLNRDGEEERRALLFFWINAVTLAFGLLHPLAFVPRKSVQSEPDTWWVAVCLGENGRIKANCVGVV